ncbi:response regulator [Dickeya sp. ws52]|uniref:response regulator n=1 Tax=Dickeya sp. ws52 TaxID=2576377 RepID=UPI001180B381|nr:response regulator [Dickeya sp. ws52]TYL44448.1 response regulator transcription factor [Dickeya sp. ws52]
MSPKRILIIEDDADAASVLEAYLKRDNFQVLLARDGVSGLEMALRAKPALILLDVMLPGMNGTEVLAALRRKSDVPVIMVTAMGDDTDKIGALRYGADDYVTKPYHPGEVVARVQAVLRRTCGAMTPGKPLSFGPLVVDQDAMLAAVTDAQGDSRPLDLTPTEFSLLTTMLRAQTRAFSRQELLEACLPDSDALERVVDTHIYNLRKKLEAVGIGDVLLTVRAVGYRFRQP